MSGKDTPTVNILAHNKQVLVRALGIDHQLQTCADLLRPLDLDDPKDRNDLMMHFIERGGLQELSEEHTIAA